MRCSHDACGVSGHPPGSRSNWLPFFTLVASSIERLGVSLPRSNGAATMSNYSTESASFRAPCRFRLPNQERRRRQGVQVVAGQGCCLTATSAVRLAVGLPAGAAGWLPVPVQAGRPPFRGTAPGLEDQATDEPGKIGRSRTRVGPPRKVGLVPSAAKRSPD